MKKCPACAEEIQDEAIKCKHCGSDLREGAKTNVSSNKSVVSKNLGLIVALILIVTSFLVWFLVGTGQVNLAKARANLSEVNLILRTISTASESYSVANQGNYPIDIAALIPSYLNQNYCNSTVDGYTLTCSFTNTNYTITATPTQGGQSLSISTGGVLR